MKPDIPFDRLFSISGFEALRLLRLTVSEFPDQSVEELVEVLDRRWPGSSDYDLETALALDKLVESTAPTDSILFYRACVQAVMFQEMPTWAQLMTIGRGRFLMSIAKDEYRDIRSVFREARLLDDPPSEVDILWWDEMKERVRSTHSLDVMARARRAERLTLDLERRKLQDLGSELLPRWIAIEDDTVGYDILSYEASVEGFVAIQIEVKSTISSPLKFNVSRNEWKQADTVGDKYKFYIWDLEKSPPALFQRSVEEVRPHIPTDGLEGVWTNVRIPVDSASGMEPIDTDWEKD